MFCTAVLSIMLASHNTDTSFEIHKYMRTVYTSLAILIMLCW